MKDHREITLNQICSDEVTPDKIKAGEVTKEKIKVGEITDNMFSGEIVEDE